MGQGPPRPPDRALPSGTTVALGAVRATWSDRSAGDLRPTDGSPSGSAALDAFAARAVATGGAVADRARAVGCEAVTPVAWVRQVHGTAVRVVADGARGGGQGEGDALVSTSPAARLAVLTADCASIALASPEGPFAAVHAGWRGLVAGVVERAADVLRAHGATTVVGASGPCIHPECYEFAHDDLGRVAARYGDRVRGRTAQGRPALDVPAAVAVALERAGVEQVPGVEACTACGGPYFSHRARADTGRQALVVWSTAGPGAS